MKRGYKGKLYVEIASRTFTVIVRAGMTLNQLRFVRGNPKPSDSALATLERTALANNEALVYGEEGHPAKALIGKQSVKLSVNLHANDPSEAVAYKAKKNTPVIDLSKINYYDPNDFWEIGRDPGKRGLRS